MIGVMELAKWCGVRGCVRLLRPYDRINQVLLTFRVAGAGKTVLA